MFKVAVIFFFLGVLGLILGVFGFAGLTVEVGELVIAVFFILALISFMGTSDSEHFRLE